MWVQGTNEEQKKEKNSGKGRRSARKDMKREQKTNVALSAKINRYTCVRALHTQDA